MSFARRHSSYPFYDKASIAMSNEDEASSLLLNEWQSAIDSKPREHTHLRCNSNLRAYAVDQPLAKPPQSCFYSIPLPIRVIVVEEDSNIFARCGRNIIWKEVADPVTTLQIPCSVRVRPKAVYEDDTRGLSE